MASSVAQKTGSATLVVERFSHQTSWKHVNFRINDGYLIHFGMHPKTVIFSNDESFMVYLLNSSERASRKRLTFKCKISILNLKGDKLFTKEYSEAFNISIPRHYVSLMPRSEILNRYLFYDVLTLHCEFEAIDPIVKRVQIINKISIHNDLDSLAESFKSLLTDGKLSDVTLVVGSDRKELNVHKTILAARSPVFAAMFEHDCEEKRLGKVEITDTDQEVFEQFLCFIYTGKVESMERYALDLLEAADKYQIDSLKTICGQYLSTTLSVETAANVLLIADMHQAVNLKANCIDYISDNASKVESTDGWKVLNKTRPQLLGELFIHLAKKTNR